MRHAQSDVHQNRLENDGCNLSRIFLKAPLDTREIVKGRDQHVLEACFGYAETAWYRRRTIDVAKIRRVRLYADESRVMQAVVSPFELHNLVASGGRPGQTDTMHGRLGSAVAETNHLDRKALADFFREFPFHVMRHAEHGSGRQALPHSFHHCGMTVPGH